MSDDLERRLRERGTRGYPFHHDKDDDLCEAADELARLRAENAALRVAANAVVERWDTPLWKDAEPTEAFIGRLRAALKEGADK